MNALSHELNDRFSAVPVSTTTKQLVYGDCGDGRVVFLPEAEAKERAQLVGLLGKKSMTWGVLRTVAPHLYSKYILPVLKSEWEDIEEDVRGLSKRSRITLDDVKQWYTRPHYGVHPPDDMCIDPSTDDPYRREPPFLTWPTTDMLFWMPEEVQELGTKSVGFDYEGLEFEEHAVRAVVARLRNLGYSCRRATRLVQSACGF